MPKVRRDEVRDRVSEAKSKSGNRVATGIEKDIGTRS